MTYSKRIMTKKSIEEIIQDSLKIIPDLNINSTVSNMANLHHAALPRGRKRSLKRVIAEIVRHENDNNID